MDSSTTTHPEWVREVDEDTGWGPCHPIALEDGNDVDLDLSHHPDEGVKIHLFGASVDPLTITDARHLAGALLDLADIADPGKLATQKLRNLIDGVRYGLTDADELDNALTAVEDACGLPVTYAMDA